MSDLGGVFMAASLCVLVTGNPPGSPISGRLRPVKVRWQIA
jgi:hypothetical protein